MVGGKRGIDHVTMVYCIDEPKTWHRISCRPKISIARELLWDLYGIAIALPNQSVDPFLSSRLITRYPLA